MNINTQHLTWGTYLLFMPLHFKLADLTKSCVEYNRIKNSSKITSLPDQSTNIFCYSYPNHNILFQGIYSTLFITVSAIWQASYLTPILQSCAGIRLHDIFVCRDGDYFRLGNHSVIHSCSQDQQLYTFDPYRSLFMCLHVIAKEEKETVNKVKKIIIKEQVIKLGKIIFTNLRF